MESLIKILGGSKLKTIFFLFLFLVVLQSFQKLKDNECTMCKYEIKAYWEDLLEEMVEGNLKNVQSMMTIEGFNSIIRKRSEEEYKEIIIEFGLFYKNKPVEVIVNKDDNVSLSIGLNEPEKGIYPSGVILKCLDKSWKLANFLPSK